MLHKACEICPDQRIQIGVSYAEVSRFRRFWGVTFIYLPVILFPFAIAIASMTRFSLTVLGAKNVKRYRDFVPQWNSHRYNFKEQIVMSDYGRHVHLGWRVFWFFNCHLYCPMSVGLFDYLSYLLKAVENWWCPFHHARKHEYASAPFDPSYWHVKPGQIDKLHENDRQNPTWNSIIE